MADRPNVSNHLSGSPDDLLDSWKEIAIYLQRSVRTIQRWEQLNELPVHRYTVAGTRGVHAFKTELDAWRQGNASGSATVRPEQSPLTRWPQWRAVTYAIASLVAAAVGLQVWITRGHDTTVRTGESRLAAESPNRASRLPANPAAYEAYMLGRFFSEKHTEAGVRRGLTFLDEAVAKEPRYAEAYVESAKAYTSLALSGSALPEEVMPRARAAVTKALQLDSQLAEAYFTRASIRWYGDFDWNGAQHDLEQALRLKPTSPEESLYADVLAALGRLEEALATIQRARQRDPSSIARNERMGVILYLSRRYDQAIQQFRDMVEMDPTSPIGHFDMAKVYLETGQFDDAITEARYASSLSRDNPRMLSMLIYVLLRAGHRAEALNTLAHLKALSSTRHVSAIDWARVYIGLGDTAQALSWLERAYEEHMNPIVYLKIDPMYAPLRPLPQFQDLLRRIGLGG